MTNPRYALAVFVVLPAVSIIALFICGGLYGIGTGFAALGVGLGFTLVTVLLWIFQVGVKKQPPPRPGSRSNHPTTP